MKKIAVSKINEADRAEFSAKFIEFGGSIEASQPWNNAGFYWANHQVRIDTPEEMAYDFVCIMHNVARMAEEGSFLGNA